MPNKRLSGTKLELTPFAEAFRADVRGLSYADADAGPDEAEAVRRALAQHLLLNIVLDESPELRDLESFFSPLGPLNARTPEVKEHYGILARVEGMSDDAEARLHVSNAATIRGDQRGQPGGNDELLWHNDQAWLVGPLEGDQLPRSD